TPRKDKGVAPSWLLVSDKYIRRDAHGSNPQGNSYLVLAKDQSGTPRGSARAGQYAAGVIIYDNRSLKEIGNGENVCNWLNSACYYAPRKPQSPIVAAYQSMYKLGDDGGLQWAPGFYGDHVTSFGGYLPPTNSSGIN